MNLSEYSSTDPTPITFAALETALVQLGFDIVIGPDYRLYHHDPTDTRLLMPDFPYEQAADELRLIEVRKMVVERGVARRERLERLLLHPPARRRTARVRTTTRQITHVIPDEAKA